MDIQYKNLKNRSTYICAKNINISGPSKFRGLFHFFGRFGLFRIFDRRMSNPGVNLGNIRRANSVLHHGHHESNYKISRDKER